MIGALAFLVALVLGVLNLVMPEQIISWWWIAFIWPVLPLLVLAAVYLLLFVGIGAAAGTMAAIDWKRNRK